MRVWTPTEVLGCQAGVALECVAGHVTHVTDRKTGTNDYGPWSIQNVTIGDGGNRVKVKLMNQGELVKEALNHKLYVIAGQGKKGQPIGLVTELDTYKGQTSIIVKANENASLSWNPPAGAGEGGTQQPPAQKPATPPPTQQAPPPPQTQQAPPPPPPQNAPPPIQPAGESAPPQQKPPVDPSNPVDVKRAWSKVDKGLNKLRRLRLRTLTVALAIQRDASTMGYQMASDHVEKIDSWLAIECCRNGLLVDVPEMDPPGIAHGTDAGNPNA